jgi:hypothetical protein
MKLAVKMHPEGMPVLVVKYHPEEWQVLQRKWEELGLERRMSENLWGVGWRGEFYKERNSLMENLLKGLFEVEGLRYRIFSDINSPLFKDNRVNVGILRAIPNENYEVVCPLPRLINIDDLVVLRDVLADAVRLILRIVVSTEVEIRFVINGREIGTVEGGEA